MQARLEANPGKLDALAEMEKTGGEPRGYEHVFTFHNGATSYCAVRGFRGALHV